MTTARGDSYQFPSIACCHHNAKLVRRNVRPVPASPLRHVQSPDPADDHTAAYLLPGKFARLGSEVKDANKCYWEAGALCRDEEGRRRRRPEPAEIYSNSSPPAIEARFQRTPLPSEDRNREIILQAR